MNRIVGNCYIIDSAGLWLTSNSASNGTFIDFDFQSATFVSVTSGDIEITLQSDTAGNSVLRMFNALNNGTQSMYWPAGNSIHERMFVKTCNEGTAFLYFA